MSVFQLIGLLILTFTSLSSGYVVSDAKKMQLDHGQLFNSMERQALQKEIMRIMESFSEDDEEFSESDEDTTGLKMDAEEQSGPCIESIEVSVRTGTKADHDNAKQTKSPYQGLRVVIQGSNHSATIPGSKPFGSVTTASLHVSDFYPPISACGKKQVTPESAYLIAHGNDGWLVASINTSVVYSNGNVKLLTEDMDLYKFVDRDNAGSYAYDARIVPLTKHLEYVQGQCIHYLYINAQTKNKDHAGYGAPHFHRLMFRLRCSEKELEIQTTKPAFKDEEYDMAVNFAGKFGCVKISDIYDIHLKLGTTNGWFIESFMTEVQLGDGSQQVLTNNTIDAWVNDETPTFTSRALFLPQPLC